MVTMKIITLWFVVASAKFDRRGRRGGVACDLQAIREEHPKEID